MADVYCIIEVKGNDFKNGWYNIIMGRVKKVLHAVAFVIAVWGIAFAVVCLYTKEAIR
jgi:hypothetical protein